MTTDEEPYTIDWCITHEVRALRSNHHTDPTCNVVRLRATAPEPFNFNRHVEREAWWEEHENAPVNAVVRIPGIFVVEVVLAPWADDSLRDTLPPAIVELATSCARDVALVDHEDDHTVVSVEWESGYSDSGFAEWEDV